MAEAVGAEIIVIPNQFVGGVMPIKGLQVNANGDRFTNEAAFYNLIWNDLLATTGDINNMRPILIIDSATMETSTVVSYMQDGKSYTIHGRSWLRRDSIQTSSLQLLKWCKL